MRADLMATDADITLRTADSQQTERPTPMLRVLFEGALGPSSMPPQRLGLRSLMLGRAVSDGLKLEDPRASRKHALLRQDGDTGRVVLEDSSSNGTFVNGERIQRVVLEDGDVVRIGDSFLLLRYMPPGLEDAAIPELVGDHPSMWRLRHAIARVAPTDATVLIHGESGTGKELVARAVHELSGRTGAFVAVNCAAIPATLAESQLFGHEAGSFTGANKSHPGYFRAAHGGTLFFDEVGELAPSLQPKLLRVLEEHAVTPVGGTTQVPCDVRVVAATNRDLQTAIDDGSFRGDLYARLAEICIQPPALRERREDILPLLELQLGARAERIQPNLVEALLLHRFRFNVRELFKIGRQLEIHGAGANKLGLELVEERLSRPAPTRDSAPAPAHRGPTATPGPIARAPAARESSVPSRELFEALMGEYGANISKVARALGRSRRQVYRYIEMYELDVEAFRS